jgi:hypothetical protein
MSISKIVDCDYVKTTDIVNKSLLIRQLNEFNMYFHLQKFEDNVYNTIVY